MVAVVMPVATVMPVSVSVASPVALLISLEMPGRSASASGAFVIFRYAAIVAVLRIEAIIYMAMKVIGTTKPRTDAYEGASAKPLWAIVSIGRAAIGSVVIVAVGTCGGNPDADTQLGLCPGSACCNANGGNCGKHEISVLIHMFSWQ
jgi:hypothetical protein